MRPDSLVGEPIMVSTPMQSAEIAIISKILESNTAIVDVADLFEDIDSMAYFYFLIATIWTLLLINSRVLGLLRKKAKRRHREVAFNKVTKSTWHILELLANQENWNLRRMSQNAMWACYCISYFVLMFGFVLNLMSTEQTVKINAKQIDSLDDILYQDSSDDQIVAVLTKHLFLYDRLRNSRKNSKLDQLFDLMNKTASYSFLSMPTSKADQDNSMKVIRDFFARKAVFLQSKSLVKSITIRSACITNPTEAGALYISKDTFAHGTMNAMLNKRTESRLRAYLKYHQTHGFEMGLVLETFKYVVENLIFAFIQMSTSDTTYKCLDRMGKENQIPENQPLRVINFCKLRNCCIICLITALLALTIETPNSLRLIIYVIYRLSKKLLVLCVSSSITIFYCACRQCLNLWSIVDSYFKHTFTLMLCI